MTKEEKKEEENIVEGVVDEILPGIGRLVKKMKKTSPELERRIEEADNEIKERLEKGYSGKPSVTYGYSTRTLVGREKGAPRVEPKSKSKPKAEILEPIVDVFDEGKFIKVIAELPSIKEKEIQVKTENRRIVLDAGSKERRYHKTIELSCDTAGIKKRYKNGILELEVKKRKNGT
jgi:HSP20 family protein